MSDMLAGIAGIAFLIVALLWALSLCNCEDCKGKGEDEW